MDIPLEFSSEFIAENSADEEQLFTSFLKSGEPYRSLYFKQQFHQSAKEGFASNPKAASSNGPAPGLDLDDDELYYNTTGGAAAYWQEFDLPSPTKNIKQLRSDLKEWGYCLIENALSNEQLQRMKERLSDQAAGERKAGIASWMGTAAAPGTPLPNVQFVHSLINKGEQFIQCVEHKPEGVQAGPLMEQLLNESVGENFLMSSFIAIIAHKNNMPQGLHQDQGTAPFQDPVAPYMVNTMFIMDDMCAENGGTLVVPGSHKILSSYQSGAEITEPLPPAINLNAPAGTVMIFEGRLLHGTGVNKTDKPRMMMVMSSIKPFMRQQELHILSAKSEVLKNASGKLLYRLGARPTGLGGIEGAWNGDYLVNQRLAIERGDYQRVGQLSPNSNIEQLSLHYGYRDSEIGRKQAPHQADADPAVTAQYADAPVPNWMFEGEKFPSKKGTAY